MILLTTELHEAVRRAYPGVDFSMRQLPDGPVIDTWHSETTPPTQAEISALWDAYVAEQQTAATEASALRQRIITLAQSAVGVQIDQLTAGQVRALVAILLWKAGAIDKNGAIRPLSEWVR